MKVLIARLCHETNSFSPVATPIAAFAPTYGAEALRSQEGLRSSMAAFIDAARAIGAEICTPLSAFALPSGLVDAQAYKDLSETIVQAVPGCDAILLDLHGAMATQTSSDGEGDLLEYIRAVAPHTPIGVALDLHGNISAKMVKHADVMAGFKTYPHIDIYETGMLVARLLLAMAQGKARYCVRWQPLPLMSHTLRSTTNEGAMRRAVETAQALQSDAVAAVSVFAGFALVDIAAPCVSVVVTCRDDAASKDEAKAVISTLATQIWREREGFVYTGEPLEASLRQAQTLAQTASKPILLLDHSDNCGSGGTCDRMDVFNACHSAGFSGLLFGPLADPEAVEKLIDAGVDAEVRLPLGNKVALPAIGVAPQPATVSGRVRAISNGQYVITGPTYTGQPCSMGRTVFLDVGWAHIVICEQPHEPWDLGVFHCIGIDPRSYRYILLKSRMYCRPVFLPIASGLVECQGVGVTSSDYSIFTYKHLHRPVYPLEPSTSAAELVDGSH